MFILYDKKVDVDKIGVTKNNSVMIFFFKNTVIHGIDGFGYIAALLGNKSSSRFHNSRIVVTIERIMPLCFGNNAAVKAILTVIIFLNVKIF